MLHKEYHLPSQPIPSGSRIYEERLQISGLSFRKRAAIAFCVGRDRKLIFTLDPTNRHDANAIRIIGRWRGWIFQKEQLLGYIPKEIAASLHRAHVAELVVPRLLKTFVSDGGYAEILFQVTGPRDRYSDYLAIRNGDRG